jgi:pimeloyl-ACP methyl ester carboxylesterase
MANDSAFFWNQTSDCGGRAKELYPAPRSWAEQAYPKPIHYNKLPKGGHFAAREEPKLFAEEVRAGFRSLRS